MARGGQQKAECRPEGACRSHKPHCNNEGGCGKCRRHCECEVGKPARLAWEAERIQRTAVVTPDRPIRSTRTKGPILDTPGVKITEGDEILDAKGFIKVFPPSKNILNLLPKDLENFKLRVSMCSTYKQAAAAWASSMLDVFIGVFTPNIHEKKAIKADIIDSLAKKESSLGVDISKTNRFQNRCMQFPEKTLDLMKNLKRNSPSYYTLRAALVDQFSKEELDALVDAPESVTLEGCSLEAAGEHDTSGTMAVATRSQTALQQKHLDLLSKQKKPRPTFGRKARESARKHYADLSERFSLSEDARRSLSRVKEDVLEEVVMFIVGNCKTISWGQREALIDAESGQTMSVPNLVRTDNATRMWEKYSETKQRQQEEYEMSSGAVPPAEACEHVDPPLLPPAKPIGRSLFFQLVGALTGGEERLLRAVDYVSGFLLDDTCHELQRIISDLVTPVEQETVTRHLTIVRNFLKNQYKGHVEKSDSFHLHGIEFGLSKTSSSEDKYQWHEKYPHWSFYSASQLKELARDRGIDVKTVKKKNDLVQLLEVQDKLYAASKPPGNRYYHWSSVSQSEMVAEYKRRSLSIPRPVPSKQIMAEKLAADDLLKHWKTKSDATIRFVLQARSIGVKNLVSRGQLLIQVVASDLRGDGLPAPAQPEGGDQNSESSTTTEESVPPCLVVDWSKLKKAELVDEIKSRGIPFRTNDRKSVLVKLLVDNDEEASTKKPMSVDDETTVEETSSSNETDGVWHKQGSSSGSGSSCRCCQSKKSNGSATADYCALVATVLSDEGSDDDEQSITSGPDHDVQSAAGVSISPEASFDDTSIASETVSDIEDTPPSSSTCCDACNFVVWFLREELKTAVEAAAERAEVSKEQVDSALEYLADAEQKFLLYQGHCVRAVNQQREIARREQRLIDRCNGERNTECTHLMLVMDFKMKWEAMYLKEKMTDHYGKRGVSWHGFLAVFYLYDREQGCPVRHVVKLDQILNGTNQQNGITVFTLLEAALHFLMKEFPNAEIDALQSDNANCYHKKELLYGIVFLNQLMMQKGGPIIRSIIHTETQEGKCLIDAHFAAATALIHRWLKKTKPNELKQVTSPEELAGALSDEGGLLNCGVQHVVFDDDVFAQMQEFCATTKKTAVELLEYFSRSNEIVFFPEEDKEKGSDWTNADLTDPSTWKSACFFIRAKAYSGIGDGAKFMIDLREGTVEVCGEDVQESPEGILSSDGEFAAEDLDEGHELSEVILDEDDPEDIFFDDVDPVCADPKVKKIAWTLGDKTYDPKKMVSGVKVTHAMPLGKIEGKRRAARALLDAKNSSESTAAAAQPRRNASARAAAILASGMYEEFGIRDGHDGDIPEYLLARGYSVPQEHVRQRGWARRPPVGEMYGRKYAKKYHAILLEMYNRGKKESSKKMGPGIMYKELMKRFPGVYTLPGLGEISSFISAQIQKDKIENQKRKPRRDNNEVDPTEGGAEAPVEDATDTSVGTNDKVKRNKRGQQLQVFANYDRAITDIVERYDGDIAPDHVYAKFYEMFREDQNKPDKNAVKALISRRRAACYSQRKRSLIG